MVARLVHTQEVASSSLAPASIHPPVGAIGFCAPVGRLGRAIAWRQHVLLRNGAGCSHVVIYIGEGHIPRRVAVEEENPVIPLTWEARRPRCRLLPLWEWDGRYVEWYAPLPAFTEEEARVLRSISYFVHDRIPYSGLDVLRFLLAGYPNRRDPGLFCSEGVAELYLAVRDQDLSQLGAPWTVDPRTAYQAVRHPHGGFVLWCDKADSSEQWR